MNWLWIIKKRKQRLHNPMFFGAANSAIRLGLGSEYSGAPPEPPPPEDLLTDYDAEQLTDYDAVDLRDY